MGPAVDNDEMIGKLIEGGMNAARFNFSHGSHEEHKARMDRVRRVAGMMGVHIPLILDTRGPEIRTKDFEEGYAILEKGSEFTLYAEDRPGDCNGVSITYPYLAEEVEAGTSILIDDGLCALTVEAIKGNDVVCRVLNTSRISNHKSINIPGIDIDQPFISEADRSDILFGIQEDVDFISASFVRTADDVKKLRKLLNVRYSMDLLHHIFDKLLNFPDRIGAKSPGKLLKSILFFRRQRIIFFLINFISLVTETLHREGLSHPQIMESRKDRPAHRSLCDQMTNSQLSHLFIYIF